MSKVKRRINLAENLINFISSKPPSVVFLVCLICFIIALGSLTDYVKHNEIRNPDEQDWNTFREKMTELDFCVKYQDKSDADDIKVNSNAGVTGKKETFSYELTFVIDYPGNISDIENSSILKGHIEGIYLGLQKEILEVNFKIGEVTQAYDQGCAKRLLIGKKCFRYLINGCVTLIGLPSIFPKTKANPKSCSKLKTTTENSKSLTFTSYKETPDLTHQYWCPPTHGAKAKIKKTLLDPKLFSLLTTKDKEIITRNVTYILIMLSLVVTSLIIWALFSRKKQVLYHQPTFEM